MVPGTSFLLVKPPACELEKCNVAPTVPVCELEKCNIAPNVPVCELEKCNILVLYIAPTVSVAGPLLRLQDIRTAGLSQLHENCVRYKNNGPNDKKTIPCATHTARAMSSNDYPNVKQLSQ